MTDKQGEELERIRHYVGTLDDFKNFWDQQAGADTNAYGTPDRQGYGDVHPTRDEVDSPHWNEKEKQMKEEQMREAVDQELGHTDDEAGMMANDLNVIARYAKDLEEMMKELEQSGQEVDFPHWWQSKIVLAKEYIVKAKHYIRAEMEKKPAGLPTFEDFSIDENLNASEHKKFKDLEIGDLFLRFGENGQVWKKISNKQAEFIKNAGKKTAHGNKPGSINLFPQTMDVTIYK